MTDNQIWPYYLNLFKQNTNTHFYHNYFHTHKIISKISRKYNMCTNSILKRYFYTFVFFS